MHSKKAESPTLTVVSRGAERMVGGAGSEVDSEMEGEEGVVKPYSVDSPFVCVNHKPSTVI